MHTNIWIAGDADYEQKKYEKTKNLGNIMIFMFRVIHYCL